MWFSKRSIIALAGVLAVCFWQVTRQKYLYAFLTYALMSRVFLQFPMLLHKTRTKFKWLEKRAHMSQILVSHRGGSWEAPENTLQAFCYALFNGA